MVCYWSISARLPYTFLLPFVLRPATFVHAEDVGWYTRVREERERESGGREKSTAVPRRNSAYPAHRTDSRSSGRKNTLLPISFFFLSRISRKVFAGERKGEEPLWNISWSQSSITERSFFLWLKLNLFRWQILLYPNIFNYFAIKIIV